ncbi:MAG: hypothetical protein JOY62_01615 [Acidobacteriaceae bacterium]|nr:hypothetical protein [Acidobacteriaceae bacterium]MBV9778645.1 hypothetical protein [Acidobacteriaceae bacterium]
MAVTVKPIKLWRKEIENKPGELAQTLEPLARAGADLQIVMGYRYPGHEERAAIELHPIESKKLSSTATAAGLHDASIAALLVEGDNRPGLGHGITEALARAGINLDFLVAHVMGRRYSAVLGFDNQADLKKATPLIKKAAAAKPARKRAR